MLINLSNDNTLELGDWLPLTTTEQFYDDQKPITLEEMEIRYITRILEKTHWQVFGTNSAAHLLGMNPKTLYSRMT